MVAHSSFAVSFLYRLSTFSFHQGDNRIVSSTMRGGVGPVKHPIAGLASGQQGGTM